MFDDDSYLSPAGMRDEKRTSLIIDESCRSYSIPKIPMLVDVAVTNDVDDNDGFQEGRIPERCFTSVMSFRRAFSPQRG